MLNGLAWVSKPRRKRLGYRNQAAKAVALMLLTEAPKATLAPLHTLAAAHRFRRRIKGHFLSSRSRTPMHYSLASLSLLAALGSPRGAKPTPAVPSLRRSLVVPLRYAPTYISASIAKRPMRTSLRLFYLVTSSPTLTAVGPLKGAPYWAVRANGALSKTSFGSL